METEEKIDYDELMYLTYPLFFEELESISRRMIKKSPSIVGKESYEFCSMLLRASGGFQTMLFFYKHLWRLIETQASDQEIALATALCEERRRRFATFLPAAKSLREQLEGIEMVDKVVVICEADEETDQPKGYWYVNARLKDEDAYADPDAVVAALQDGLGVALSKWNQETADLPMAEEPVWKAPLSILHEKIDELTLEWPIPQNFIDNPMDHNKPLFWFPMAFDGGFQ